MKLLALTDVAVTEWGLRSKLWQHGYRRGLSGAPIKNPYPAETKNHEDYRKGYVKGYIEFVCKRRPELCR